MDGDAGRAVDPGRPEYVWRQVAEHLEGRIRSGDLPAGARLPGERDLAEEYGVAVGTVRRAVQDLRDRELVVTLPARGTFVAQGVGGDS